ncbi:hypothetical protein [Pseudoduganella rivuli]|nr:hypothetical protein [Pseudoduganella rivuli]
MKTFAAEYAMIVVSILTALALEHAATSWHRKHQAHEAEDRIKAEIAYNLAELRKNIARNELEIKKFSELRELMRDAIEQGDDKTGQDKAAFTAELNRRHKEKTRGHFDLKVGTPVLRREAWEVAVASQAASWIDTAALQRYSSVYATQRDMTPFLNSTITTLSGPAVLGTMTQMSVKGTKTTREIFQFYADLCNTLQLLQGSMKDLESTITQNMGKA